MYFPPKAAVSELVNSLKGVSSRRLRQEFPDLVRHFWRAQRLWSGSQFAGSVGGTLLSVVRQYIEQRNRPLGGGPGPTVRARVQSRGQSRFQIRFTTGMKARRNVNRPGSDSHPLPGLQPARRLGSAEPRRRG